jgi:hypothetical protein
VVTVLRKHERGAGDENTTTTVTGACLLRALRLLHQLAGSAPHQEGCLTNQAI